jgi:hypothetical protein
MVRAQAFAAPAHLVRLQQAVPPQQKIVTARLLAIRCNERATAAHYPRVLRNPVTLVTPMIFIAGAKSIGIENRASDEFHNDEILADRGGEQCALHV